MKEKHRLKKAGNTIFTMRDIDEQGISSIANKALMKFVHIKKIHLSVDMDALDPVEAPGVGTPVPGGISYREAHLLMEVFADSGKLNSMELIPCSSISRMVKIVIPAFLSLCFSFISRSL